MGDKIWLELLFQQISYTYSLPRNVFFILMKLIMNYVYILNITNSLTAINYFVQEYS